MPARRKTAKRTAHKQPASATLVRELEAALGQLAEGSDFEKDWAAVAALQAKLARPEHAAAAALVRKRLHESEDYLVWANVLAGIAGDAAIPDLLKVGAAGEIDNRLDAVLFDLFDKHPAAARRHVAAALRSKQARLAKFARYAQGFLPA